MPGLKRDSRACRFCLSNPENFAEKLAPYITKRVWIASMNHEELTNDLFRRYFPEWLVEFYVAEEMKRTIETFETRGVPAFYHSLHRAAKRDRRERRQAKIEERKNSGSVQKSNAAVIKKINEEDLQPSLFD